MRKLLIFLITLISVSAAGQTRFPVDTLIVKYIKSKTVTKLIYISDTLVLKDGTKQTTAFTNTLKSNYNSAYNLMHTHSNSSALDSVKNNGDGTKYLANDGTYKTVASGGGTWGTITGTLSSQTDLQNVLNEKISTEADPVVKAINGIVKGNGSSISAAQSRIDYINPADSMLLSKRLIIFS